MFQVFSKLRYVLRILTILCLIFVFCPSFLVSCSGQEQSVTVMTAIKGVDGVSDPNYIMVLAILIPVLFLVLLFAEKFEEKRVERIICVGTIADLVLWILFHGKVKELAESYGFSFRVCAWYKFNIIVHLVMIMLTALTIYKKLTLEADLFDLFPAGGRQITIKGMADAVSQMAGAVTQNKEDVMGYCSKCGAALQNGSRFCIKCGAPVPTDVIETYEKKKNATTETKQMTDENPTTE